MPPRSSLRYFPLLRVLLRLAVVVPGTTAILFTKSGLGICGDDFTTFPTSGEVYCAAACNQIPSCSGFSYEKIPETNSEEGICVLHSSYFPPNGQSNTYCYIPGKKYKNRNSRVFLQVHVNF
ncbi:hypothetical protein SK128_013695 [Halocaridina rubra]|uniref:Apple domain-containing protein n=1 Tax=Halocaridina rubra TaxID=373956 RepID=A0AAN8WII1_HALRR